MLLSSLSRTLSPLRIARLREVSRKEMGKRNVSEENIFRMWGEDDGVSLRGLM